ncbi:STAS domain-containing protein [Phytohabitans houttuyneae]|uniref:Anti-anti-sigma factor n=1 Tax=Phytohabitans houttuyneae TaxID=1076126 RepID=A0A6V8KQT9_9ACTN|nr:STAS domain-containing protein [Phytohabitans houttuyneae]GFJ84236.1 anti-anti-sigma factor [Phytohabitans houttuyneae]
MSAPLAITPSRDADGATVLTVTGEIDMSNAGALADALDRAPAPVVVDMSAVEYLDSAGLAVLFAHADGLTLVANPRLGPVLTISGLAELATVHNAGTGDDPR